MAGDILKVAISYYCNKRIDSLESAAMKIYISADMIAYLPNVERIDNHTVRFVGSIIELSMFIEMVLGYPPTMN